MYANLKFWFRTTYFIHVWKLNNSTFWVKVSVENVILEHNMGKLTKYESMPYFSIY